MSLEEILEHSIKDLAPDQLCAKIREQDADIKVLRKILAAVFHYSYTEVEYPAGIMDLVYKNVPGSDSWEPLKKVKISRSPILRTDKRAMNIVIAAAQEVAKALEEQEASLKKRKMAVLADNVRRKWGSLIANIGILKEFLRNVDIVDTAVITEPKGEE